MSQEIRVILAVVLSAAIFMVSQTFFAPPPAPLPTGQPVTQSSAPDTIKAVADNPNKPANQDIIDASEDPEFIAEVKEIKLSTDKVAVTLNTKGARLTSYQIKNYSTNADKDSPAKDLLRETADSSALFLGLKGYDSLNNERVFQVVNEENLDRGGKRVVLAWQDKNIRVEKTIEVGNGVSPYAVLTRFKVINRSANNMLLTPYLENHIRQKNLPATTGWLQKMSNPQPDTFHPQYFMNKTLTSHLDWNKFVEDRAVGTLAWTAIADRYFIFSAGEVSATPEQREAHFKRDGDFLNARFYGAEQGLKPGAELKGEFYSYIGPKEMAELTRLPIQLNSAVDYGWFDFVARPILWLMGTIHKFVPNWGLVIILLTFIVKMLLHPVNKKSLTSMKAMQQLQPKLQEIKKRYPDDQQKQNEEVMQLFRTHKVNPLGGCLPMLMQMPIYIALYKVLWNAIELYHAPFLWYRDLSAPDPYFVAPVLLGVFMFFQQKLTPNASADPAQQKMMMFMPVMFSVFMLFLPVGLVIYIFVNTLMSVIQQFMLKRDLSFKDLLTGKWQAREA